MRDPTCVTGLPLLLRGKMSRRNTQEAGNAIGKYLLCPLNGQKMELARMHSKNGRATNGRPSIAELRQADSVIDLR